MAFDDPPPRVEIDEKHLAEWVEFGLDSFRSYLTKHARFDQYLRDHPSAPDADIPDEDAQRPT